MKAKRLSGLFDWFNINKKRKEKAWEEINYFKRKEASLGSFYFVIYFCAWYCGFICAYERRNQKEREREREKKISIIIKNIYKY